MSPSTIATRPSWTPELAQALHNLRTQFAEWKPTWSESSALSPEERAVVPVERVPTGVRLSSVVADPSPRLPDCLLNGSVRPLGVPIFFYSVGELPATKDAKSGTKVLFFVHGGGMVVGHPTDDGELPWLSELVLKLGDGAIVVAPSYRLATSPDGVFPAALQDVLSAYAYVLHDGYRPENIVLVGASAGGNLALVLAYLLAQAGEPLPDRICAIAPASDQAYDLSEYARAQADADVFNVHSLQLASAQYLRSSSGVAQTGAPSPTDPLVSPAYIQSYPSHWPRTLILGGGADQLVDGARRVTKNMKESGVEVEYVEEEDMPHGFWFFPFMPTRGATIERLAKFAL